MYLINLLLLCLFYRLIDCYQLVAVRLFYRSIVAGYFRSSEVSPSCQSIHRELIVSFVKSHLALQYICPVISTRCVCMCVCVRESDYTAIVWLFSEASLQVNLHMCYSSTCLRYSYICIRYF